MRKTKVLPFEKSIELKTMLKRRVLGMGAELKNTVSLGCDDKIFISPPNGNLTNPEALERLEKAVDGFISFSEKTEIEAVAVDLHPDMRSTITGGKIAEKLSASLVSVQHHHAHAAACMAEHCLNEALAFVFDGAGFGTDGNIWGSELLRVSPEGFSRLATFAPSPLPGGDAAVRCPVRQLVARLHDAGLSPAEYAEDLKKYFDVGGEEIKIWDLQCAKNLNAPASHGAGRLFDAFSAMLGLCSENISGEAEPAMRLEKAVRKNSSGTYRMEKTFDLFEKENMLFVDWSPLFRNFHGYKPEKASGGKLLRRFSVSEIAFAFHTAVADSAVEMAKYGMEKSPFRNVVLTGGVFANEILKDLLVSRLAVLDLKVFFHREISTGDSGISVGQAAAAGNFNPNWI